MSRLGNDFHGIGTDILVLLFLNFLQRRKILLGRVERSNVRNLWARSLLLAALLVRHENRGQLLLLMILNKKYYHSVTR